jgi:tetratricopeptide (TPR) repeat protein
MGKTTRFLTVLPAFLILLVGCTPRQSLGKLEADDLYLSLIAQALSSEQSGDLNRAIAAYRRALRLNPGSALLNMQLAHAYYQLGNHTLAVHFGKRAVRLDPGEADYRLVLGNAHMLAKDLKQSAAQYRQAYRLRPADNILLTLAGLYEAQGMADSAANILQRRLEGRDDPALRVQLASMLARARRWEEALGQYRLVAAVDSSNPSTLAALAGLHQVLGRTDSALHYYSKAEELDPANVPLKAGIVNLLQGIKDYRAAALQAQDILKLDPSNQAVRLQLARLYFFLPDLRQAEAQYLALLELDSANTEALYTVSKIRLDRKDYPGALDFLRQTLSLMPRLQDGWYYLGLCHLALDHSDSARAAFELSRKHGNRLETDYQTAIAYSALERYRQALPYYQKLHPKKCKNVPFLFGYGSALERSGDYPAAVQVFRQLLKRDPGHASALNYLGYMFAERGENLAEAESLIAKAIQAEPDNPYFIDSMGWVFFMSGRFEQARSELERAVSLMPDDATLREHLGDAYRALGQRDAALAQWRKALEIEPGKKDLEGKIDALSPGP